MEDELRELEQEELDKELLSTGTRAQDLPEVPTVDIKAPASGEKKKGKTNTTNHRIKYFQLISEFFFPSCSEVHRRRRRYENTFVMGKLSIQAINGQTHQNNSKLSLPITNIISFILTFVKRKKDFINYYIQSIQK